MATEIGKAYVQIMPSARGIKSSIESELSGAGAKPSRAAGKRSGEGFGQAFKRTLKKLAIAATVGKVVKDGLSAGAELEQNLGGTEAVFGNYAGRVKKIAKDAYKNMGLSASDYMATANKMASLFQGSGISQQESLKLTSDAMQRAADVASVMGISMEEAMYSVAGAAKGNFTMMDNLGVAMNATALEAYAAEKGMENFSFKTASTAEKATLAMQMFMDRTQQYAGNFVRESNETISGSLGAMKAAWKDFLGNLALGQDVTPALKTLIERVGIAIKNVAPVVINILKGLVTSIYSYLVTEGPTLFQNALTFFSGLIQGVMASLPQLMGNLGQIIATIFDFLVKEGPNLIKIAMEFFANLALGVIHALPAIGQALLSMIGSVFDFLSKQGPGLLQAAANLFEKIADGLMTALPKLIPKLLSGMSKVFGALLGLGQKVAEIGLNLFSKLMDNLPGILSKINEKLPDIIRGIGSGLLKLAGALVAVGVKLFVSLVKNLPGILVEFVKAAAIIVMTIVDTIIGFIPQMISIGADLIKGLWQGIANAAKWLWDKIAGFFKGLVNGIKKFLGIKSPSRVMAGIGEMMDRGLVAGIEEHSGLVDGAMEKLVDITGKDFGAGIDIGANIKPGNLNALTYKPGQIKATESSVLAALSVIAELLRQGLHGDVYIDGDSLVGKIIAKVDEALAQRQIDEELGGGRVGALI